MPLQKLTLKPGVNRENTRYTNEGGWYESDKVRFRQGTPEKIGGWQRISASTFLGVCRSLWNWVTLTSQNLLGVGTNLKFYIENGGAYYDITPIRASSTINNNPFVATLGSSTVTVTDTAHGGITNDYVTFSGATGLGGNITATVLNAQYQITVITSNSYTINVAVAAIAADVSGSPGGGAAVVAVYQINTGPAYVNPLSGWGAGTWGSGAWGIGTTTTDAIRIWNQLNWGEDLIYGPRGGPLYYWDANIGIDSSGGLAVTISNASPCILTSTVVFADGTPITLSTTGALPTGLTLGTTYYLNYITSTTYNLSSNFALVTASCSGPGANTFTVTVANGTLVAGMRIYYFSSGVLTSLGTLTLTGTGTGGAGTYSVSAGAAVASTSFSGGTVVNTSSAGSGTQIISSRGMLLSTLPGSDGYCPLYQNTFTVSDASRFLIVFGTNDYGSTTIDPMLIRWSDQESLTTWYPAITNQAGSVRLSHGSKIVTTLQSRQEIVVWTDSALYSLQYLGPPYVWGTQLLADNVSIGGPNAAAMASGITYWMGVDKFYKYDGRVQTLNCDLLRYVYNDINSNQYDQLFASTNEGFNEVWFFYCSSSSSAIDRYVIYNYVENVWMYGTLGRTAWLDSGLRNYPIAATYSYNIVQHEYGVDDNTSGTPVAIEASVTSSQFDIGDGHNMAFAWRMLPDLTFNGSTAGTTPQLTMQLLPLQNSGSGYNDPKSVGNAYNQSFPTAAQAAAFQAAATVALKMAVGTLPIDLYYDLTGNGTVDISDAVGFLQLAVGIPLTYTPNPLSIYTTITSMGGEAQAYVTATQTYPIDLDTYTGQIYIRVRGRQMAMRITSNQVGTQWQLGSPRIDLRPDGRR